MIGSNTYKFIVGVKKLQKIGDFASIFGANHAGILLGEDIFEYGAEKTKKIKKYQRHKKVGKPKLDEFDWDYLGKTINGITRVSPDKLEKLIEEDGNWGPGHYNIFNHNCHNFVTFCLKQVGFPEYNITKYFCIKRIPPGKIQIKSYYDDNSFDICGNKIANGTEVILYPSHGGKNQTFDMVYNSDNTVTFKNGNFAITVKDGKAVEGASIQISECNNTAAQKFYLVNNIFGRYNIHSAIDTQYIIKEIENKNEEDKNKKIKKLALSHFVDIYSEYSISETFRLIYK